MKLTRKSMLSGEEGSFDLSISEEEFAKCFHLWKIGEELIEDAFPMLNEEQRDFVMMGIKDWEGLA